VTTLKRTYLRWPMGFWARVKMTDNCWVWTGRSRNDAGYGEVFYKGKARLAHRVMWMETHDEPIPPGILVCHTCDNPPCVNPDHLFLGTTLDNAQDMVAKGRGRYKREKYEEWKRERVAEAARLVLERGAPHGTETGYSSGCRDACCREAMNRRHHAQRQAGVYRMVRRNGRVIYERLIPRHEVNKDHGSYWRFSAGCRCEACVQGRRAYNREAKRLSRERRAARAQAGA
jgi:hypothetical protein